MKQRGKQGGRPRRSQEQPDSAFGKALKEHLRRVEFTQAELAGESVIPEKTLSQMVKGKRTGGPTFRRDLRAIIKVLHRKKALVTLEEANRLITTIPAVSPLDNRDPGDLEIIKLFDTQASGEERAAAQNKGEVADPDVNTSSKGRDDTSLSHTMPEFATTPLQIRPSPISETAGGSERETKKRLWRRVVSVFVALIIIAGTVLSVLFIFSRQTDGCSDNAHGVTLYTEINHQGHCYTFGPGDYELARFGLEQNVSSIRNPNDAYHIILYDKEKIFYYVDKDTPVLPAEWDNRADTMHVEKHRPTSCNPGANGIIAFINTDYSGGCLFITDNLSDLTPLNFDQVIVSIQFVGSYRNTRQLVIYKQPNYKDECGAYWQNQSDLLQCARLALSVQVLPFTSPTPIPTIPGTHYAGNVAPQAILSPGSAYTVVDGNLQTEWVGGHMAQLDLSWAFPVTIHRVVIWDRKQSPSDNNQINKLKLSFSDGTSTGSIDMISPGPRCADITFPEKTVTLLHITPVDASGNNGYSEVEVWATTGPQYSNNTCVNQVQVTQTVP
jgi:hypothetical protein